MKTKHAETGMSWQSDFVKFAEKYCKHNGTKFNNCLYWILYPTLKKYFRKKLKK